VYYDHHICIVCDGPTGPNHKCPPKRIARIEAIRAGWEDREIRTDNRDTYGTRLDIGFRFYNEDYNHDN
jgi:hypothetical protein